MPTNTTVEDSRRVVESLGVTKKMAVDKHTQPSILVECGDGCGSTVKIYYGTEHYTDPSKQTLTINGVRGTVEQWLQAIQLTGATIEV